MQALVSNIGVRETLLPYRACDYSILSRLVGPTSGKVFLYQSRVLARLV